MKLQNTLQGILWLATLMGLSGVAQAHTGEMAGSGFLHGFAHPLDGLDHILAMVAVGLWAGQLGETTLWRIPLAFIGMMVLGGVAGMLGMPLPLVEPAILGSIIVLGVLIAFVARLSVRGGMGLAGLFALFHGHAHGMEMPVISEPLLYAAGFVGATLLLHAFGVAIGRDLKQGMPAKLVRASGGAIALTGVFLAIGL